MPRGTLLAMPTIIINGQKINYSENVLDTDSPTLILVHGAGSRIQVWPYAWSQYTYVRYPNAKRWLTDFPIYMIDLPGHGRSASPGRDSVDAYAQDVIDFVKAKGIKKFVVGGHSMGAAIAQTIGLMKPDGLEGLVLFGAGARMPVNDMILDGLLNEFEKTVDMIVKFSWARDAAENFTEVATQHMLATEPKVVHGDFYACSVFDVRDRLGEIEVPVLVVGASDDKMMPLKNSQFLVDNIPNATLAEIENAGHFMMTEKTHAVTKAMVKFMSAL